MDAREIEFLASALINELVNCSLRFLLQGRWWRYGVVSVNLFDPSFFMEFNLTSVGEPVAVTENGTNGTTARGDIYYFYEVRKVNHTINTTKIPCNAAIFFVLFSYRLLG